METDRRVSHDRPTQPRRATFSVAAAIGVLFLCAGCQPAWHYDWGSYQNSVWLLYSEPADKGADVGKQIDALVKEIRQTEAHAKPNEASRVPPGKYAHLGYLYAMQGDQINARECLLAEKKLYPESARFIDGLLTRMR